MISRLLSPRVALPWCAVRRTPAAAWRAPAARDCSASASAAAPLPPLDEDPGRAVGGAGVWAGGEGGEDGEETATLRNTFIMSVPRSLVAGAPEGVRRVLALQNARRSDLTRAQKSRALAQAQASPSDTGSAEVQAAVLSTRIHALTSHLQANRKDHRGKLVLTQLMHRRRRVLQHLYRTSPMRYEQAMARLELRHTAAPPVLPGYLRRFDAYKVAGTPRESRRQVKARRRKEEKAHRLQLKAHRR